MSRPGLSFPHIPEMPLFHLPHLYNSTIIKGVSQCHLAFETTLKASYTSSIQAMMMLMMLMSIICTAVQDKCKNTLCTASYRGFLCNCAKELVVIIIVKRDSNCRYCELRIKKTGDNNNLHLSNDNLLAPLLFIVVTKPCIHNGIYYWRWQLVFMSFPWLSSVGHLIIF